MTNEIRRHFALRLCVWGGKRRFRQENTVYISTRTTAMNFRLGVVIPLVSLALAACVSPPQKPIQLSQETAVSKNSRIGVVMTTLPKVGLQLPGADCLLCIAVASTANSTLSSYTQTLPYDDVPKFKTALADLLRKKGSDVKVIDEDINLASLPDLKGNAVNSPKKDFSSMRQRYEVDKLLVIDISALGMVRRYSAYVPTSDPMGLLRGTGYLINLSDNSYEWYLPVEVVKSSDGAWDEPPKFPGLTNAYFQAMELAKDSFLGPFSN